MDIGPSSLIYATRLMELYHLLATVVSKAWTVDNSPKNHRESYPFWAIDTFVLVLFIWEKLRGVGPEAKNRAKQIPWDLEAPQRITIWFALGFSKDMLENNRKYKLAQGPGNRAPKAQSDVLSPVGEFSATRGPQTTRTHQPVHMLSAYRRCDMDRLCPYELVP